ncbi:MAG TPA: MFS transporter [Candidatus Dormibacteraeota bacterium]|nr:MFS transporter [Candidatus Dormibacteraeota bacterium]
MRVPGFARMYTSLVLGRMANSVGSVAMVLFVLQRYHSPELAGATAFCASLPGILVSPVAGALLDRYGRARLIILDYFIAAVTLGAIAILSFAHALPPPLLLFVVVLSSLTGPLSWAGTRSLFPIMAPRHLWERANGLDSSGHVVATLLASPLAGVMVAFFGGEWGLLASGALFLAAAGALFNLPDPSVRGQATGSVLENAWRGLVYTVRNPTLRGIALTLSTYNMGNGVLVIAVPVLVLSRLHSGPATVGILWGIMGGVGMVSALLTGRVSTLGRERQMMFIAIVIGAAGTMVLAFAGNLAVVVVAIALLGLATGPFDVGLFTLRQRRTDPAWFGRAFAISMSLNSIGNPVGSVIAGPLISYSLTAALWLAVALTLSASLFPLLTIPAREESAASSLPG